ncbi:hypothetical protein [Variovorax boronicumulans]|uniref:hypothetical protein n=1 Tax=Variovorax boronicumulans TaxID=436515 RepID=UPI0033961EFC
MTQIDSRARAALAHPVLPINAGRLTAAARLPDIASEAALVTPAQAAVKRAGEVFP